MSERLVIRLGSQANDQISWLVWSESEQEIMASGTLNHASELATLSQRGTDSAAGTVAQVLVPASDVGLFDLELPPSNRRQALKAIPFMLEDELATDIELLHFVHGQRTGNKQRVYVTAKEKIAQWAGWLEQANIRVSQMLPDWLALPVPSADNGISLLQLGEQVLIRQGEHQGQTIALSWFEPWLAIQQQPEQQESPLVLENYGVSEQLVNFAANWQAREPMMPMLRLAMGIEQVKVNLLVGEFAVNDKQPKPWQLWRHVAMIAGVALVLIFVEKFYRINQLEAQVATVKQYSQTIYRQLNPGATRLDRLKYRINQQLKQLGSGQNDSQFLTMMTSLNQAFARVPQLKPISVKYDNRRQELRVQADGDNYQQFDQFKQVLSGEYSVTTGAMNNNGNKVNGSLTIKAAS